MGPMDNMVRGMMEKTAKRIPTQAPLPTPFATTTVRAAMIMKHTMNENVVAIDSTKQIR